MVGRSIKQCQHDRFRRKFPKRKYESTEIQKLSSSETSLLNHTYTIPEALSAILSYSLFEISVLAKSNLINHCSYALINRIRGDFETICFCWGAEISQFYSANAACD